MLGAPATLFWVSDDCYGYISNKQKSIEAKMLQPLVGIQPKVYSINTNHSINSKRILLVRWNITYRKLREIQHTFNFLKYKCIETKDF